MDRADHDTGTSRPASLREAWVALAGLSAVFLVEMLDTSLLTVALPTIGRELHASTLALSWVTGAYSVVFGGLMLVLGAVADRHGRRRTMLVGLTLLGAASLATVVVTTAGQLVVVRVLTGVAAAMTTPGTIALTFRLFADEGRRIRAITLVSTVGLVGLAVGPVVGGFVLAVAPWQVLLLVNAPVAALAIVGIRLGVAADDPADRDRTPPDVVGGVLGTATIVLTLVTPTLFVERGVGSWMPWTGAALAAAAAGAFVVRERSARHPMLDLALIARGPVSGGLAVKAAAGLAVAGLGYLVTLQLQLDRGWSPAAAALGMLPQVVVLVAAGPLVGRVVARVGVRRSVSLGGSAVVLGLAVDTALGAAAYVWVAVALVLVAAGLRVVGVVAGYAVLDGLPDDRTSTGAALVDTSSEIAAAVGVAVVGTVLATLFSGSVVAPDWTPAQTGEFRHALAVAGTVLTLTAAALTGWAAVRLRAPGEPADR